MTDNAQADDGWIEHGGRECPVESHAVVHVKFRDGTEWGPRFAGSLSRESENFWVHEPTSPGDDIIAYRVVSQ